MKKEELEEKEKELSLGLSDMLDILPIILHQFSFFLIFPLLEQHMMIPIHFKKPRKRCPYLSFGFHVRRRPQKTLSSSHCKNYGQNLSCDWSIIRKARKWYTFQHQICPEGTEISKKCFSYY